MTKRTSKRVRGAVRKLPSGRWQARVREPGGKLVSVGTFATKRAADEAIARAVARQAVGERALAKGGRIRLADYARPWLAGRIDLRPKTFELYSYLLERLILPELGDRPLEDITTARIGGWRGALLARPTLSEATVAKAYRLFRQILQVAVEEDRLLKNPCSLRGAAKEDPPELVIPDVAGVLKAAEAMPERFRALVLLCAFAGLRIGEALALRWADVDLIAGTLTIRRAVVEISGRIVEGPPKTSAARRTVDLPDIVVVGLKAHERQFPLDGPGAVLPSSLVFPSVDGTFQGRKTIWGHWRAARAKAGLGPVRLHDLRHLAATLGTLSGATTREQMARLGHTTPDAALRYQHVLEGRQRAIAQGIDRLIEATTDPPTT